MCVVRTFLATLCTFRVKYAACKPGKLPPAPGQRTPGVHITQGSSQVGSPRGGDLGTGANGPKKVVVSMGTHFRSLKSSTEYGHNVFSRPNAAWASVRAPFFRVFRGRKSSSQYGHPIFRLCLGPPPGTANLLTALGWVRVASQAWAGSG